MNKFIREGSLLKKYSSARPTASELRLTFLPSHAAVLVMILRLRQICAHPYLILVSGSRSSQMTPALTYPFRRPMKARATQLRSLVPVKTMKLGEP